MSSIISGQVGAINISGGQFVSITEADVQRNILENIAEKAVHDANNSDYELPKCYPGTRQAIQRDLTKWVQNMQRKHPIYWLYAPAGSGKTAIAKTLADFFSNSHNRYLLASFFFRRTSLHRNTEERFIATLAYQMKMNLPQTSSFITKAIQVDPIIFRKDLRVQMDSLILEPLRKACEAVSAAERETWPRLLVVDGLDECSGQGPQRKILEVVSHLVRHMSFPLAIFISCRPEAHIRTIFQGEHLSSSSVQICLPEKYHSDDDLRNFLIGKFKEIVKVHSHILEFPRNWPGRRVVELLVQKSSGQFIFASTVMKYVYVQDDNPMERLNVVLGLEKSSDNPFAELDALYRHILASVKPKYLPTVIRVLQVTLSQSEGPPNYFPVRSSLSNLSSFLGLKPGELEYSLGSLEKILVWTEPSRYMPMVKFYHASFGDFLLDESRSGPYFIDISIARTQFIVSLLCSTLSADVIPNDKEYALKVKPAIQSVADLLPFAALTEELYQVLYHMSKTTTVRKIIHNCRRRFTCTELLPQPDWQLLHGFVTALGRFPFNDTVVQDTFLDEVKKYVSQELWKYAEDPLRHLIVMFMIHPSPFFFDDFRHFILSRLLIDDHALHLDRTSLHLERFLWVNESHDLNWGFLRQFVKATGYSIKPEAYTATYLCVLKCITDLSTPVRLSAATRFAIRVSSGLYQVERYLVDREPRPYIDSDVLALWHFFCDIGGSLLGKAGPSVELQKRLEENERIIYLFSHMDGNEDRREAKWISIKEAIDEYLLRNQPFSSHLDPSSKWSSSSYIDPNASSD